MSDQFINSELLVELSTEEQQLIAGGLWVPSPFSAFPVSIPPFGLPPILPPFSPPFFGISSTGFSGTQSIQGIGTASGLGGGFATGFNRSFRSGGVSNVGLVF